MALHSLARRHAFLRATKRNHERASYGHLRRGHRGRRRPVIRPACAGDVDLWQEKDGERDE